ncbi:MAG: HAMP domain-containing histidine kinase [Muribaculaceae bacterium]|nr:HAMP domain-containing histidine kinase [Muribaculaceae bacterium]
MKRLKFILSLALSIAAIAVIKASYNLFSLYRYEKEQTLANVRKCAENAFILEMIGRMQSSEKAEQSFIRLNSFIETAQQKDGMSAKSDTLRISLATIMRFGLEFDDNKLKPDLRALDSIFFAELHRNGLTVEQAYIMESGSPHPSDKTLWKTFYKTSPSSHAEYELYITPMYKEVLKRLWGIIIPFVVLILSFSFLSIYLTQVIKKLRTLEQMKEDFTHNMTHELKTPVAVAYSAADSMLRYYDQSDENRNRQFLKIIIQRLGFLSGMIENILSMSMERFKTINLQVETFLLKPFIEEIAEMMKLKVDKPLSIDLNISEELSVYADPIHIGNVFSNFLDNAVKYSGDSVRIKITADADSITIEDNGIGIEKKYIPYIFDKFYRVNAGDRYEVGGYGLGLFYVKQIMDLHGWKIDVVSTPGKGTKFIIGMSKR